MVTYRGLERYMEKLEEIAREAKADKETAKRVIKAIEADMAKRRRQKAPPPPEGGISLREASRKYGLHHTTFLKWIKKGELPVLKKTDWRVFVDEATIIRKTKKNGDK